MAWLQQWLDWYQHSGLGAATLTIPLVETVVLFFVLTCCLLLRLTRTGLMVAYLFVYRWGWAFWNQNIGMSSTMQSAFAAGYIAFGILATAFSIIALLREQRSGA